LGIGGRGEWDDLRWQLELFFKKLKSTLGFDQSRLKRFAKVEAGLDLPLWSFVYLEWYRRRELSRKEGSKKEKERGRGQRSQGLCLGIRQEVAQAEGE
jgi:IS4 transposase